MSVDNVSNDVRIPARAAVFGQEAVGGNRFSQEINAASDRAMIDLDAIFVDAAMKYNLPVDFLKAVARAESNFRPGAVSPAGAQGIMQLMPGTARHLGVTDPFDPRQSIFGGARYLRENIDRFDGDIKLALAAYNAGWPTVKRHGGIPPFRETQNYVARIMNWLEEGVEFTAGSVAHPGWGGAQNTWGITNGNAPGGLRRAEGGDGQNSEARSYSGDNAFDMREFTNILAQMLKMKIMNMQTGSSGNGGRSFF